MSSDESTPESSDWIGLEDLECAEAWIEEDESLQWRTNRLFDPKVPFSTGLETERAMGVFVKVEPGHACECHTHDVEEVILVHRGTLEFTVGETVTTQVAGELSVVPPDVPHEFRNVGDTTAGVLGILPTTDAITTFERVVQPIGARRMGPDGPIPEDGRDDP
jgi:quercetin dioxygenase-like cupin family protein